MKTLLKLAAAILVAVALFFGLIAVASEMGGEVVTLRTTDADGAALETRLWIVEHEGSFWLRAGQAGSGWLGRIEARPQVEVEREGATRRYRAAPVPGDPGLRDRIHALMAEKYGLADRLIGLMRDGQASVPVRLEPL